MAIAHRGSQAEDMTKFLKLFDKKTEKAKETDHKANLSMLNQKL